MDTVSVIGPHEAATLICKVGVSIIGFIFLYNALKENYKVMGFAVSVALVILGILTSVGFLNLHKYTVSSIFVALGIVTFANVLQNDF